MLNPHVNFHDNRAMQTSFVLVKIRRWGGGSWRKKEKEPKALHNSV